MKCFNRISVDVSPYQNYRECILEPLHGGLHSDGDKTWTTQEADDS